MSEMVADKPVNDKQLEACFASSQSALSFSFPVVVNGAPGMLMAISTSSSGGNFGAALSPGVRFGGGRYLLKRLIGRGENSEVWLARDVSNARDVALKFLPRPFLQDKNLLELFQKEVRRNQLLQQSHIVSTYELASDYDAAAIAMEFVDGWSLATMKVDKLLHCYTVVEIEPWIRDLCDALACAHSEFGMVHGDIKPSNLLMSTRDGVKVSDFSFAALLRSESSRRGIAKNAYGGIGFLSPQQVMGEPPSKADDIYSLGATIFDLLTGTPPFYKGEIIAQICSLRAPRMSQRLAELGAQCDPISPVWEDTVAACLAKNPDDRPQSVDEVRHLLERAESSLPAVSRATKTAHSLAPADAGQSLAPVGAMPRIATSAPISPANSQRIAILFAIALVGLIMVGVVAAVWFLHGKSFSPAGHSVPPNAPAVSLDKNFNPGTGAAGAIHCLALQPDGKILVGGVFTRFNGAPVKKIVRLNPDGALDTSFQTDVPGNVSTIMVQPDGKILAGGSQGLRPGRPGRRFVRLNADGHRDDHFPGETLYNKVVRALAFQPDGKLLVGGDFTTVARRQQSGLVRLNSDDKDDDSFQFGSDASVSVDSIAVQSNGKILVAGNIGGTHLLCLNPDGSPDPQFDAKPYAGETVRTIVLDKNDKIIICGSFQGTNNVTTSYLSRLNPDGSPDPGFHSPLQPGIALSDAAIQADGKILVGGYDLLKNHAPFLGRVNADGTPDKTFQVPAMAGDIVSSIVVQPDGKLLVAGSITSVAGVPCGNIVRLNN